MSDNGPSSAELGLTEKDLGITPKKAEQPQAQAQAPEARQSRVPSINHGLTREEITQLSPEDQQIIASGKYKNFYIETKVSNDGRTHFFLKESENSSPFTEWKPSRPGENTPGSIEQVAAYGKVEATDLTGQRTQTGEDLKNLDPDTQKTLEEARRTGKIGNMGFREEVDKSGQHKFFVNDPKTGQEVQILMGKDIKMESYFPPGTKLTVGGGLVLNKSELNDLIGIVEESQGDGFKSAETRQEIETMVGMATLGDPDTREKLKKYFGMRSGIDSLFRAWSAIERSRGQDKKATAEYYLLRGILKWTEKDQVKNENDLIAERPGVGPALNIIRGRRNYFGKDYKTNHNSVVAALGGRQIVPGGPPIPGPVIQQVDTDVMLAERVLQMTQDAEKQGAYLIPPRPTPEEIEKLRKEFQGNALGFFANVTGLKLGK